MSASDSACHSIDDLLTMIASTLGGMGVEPVSGADDLPTFLVKGNENLQPKKCWSMKEVNLCDWLKTFFKNAKRSTCFDYCSISPDTVVFVETQWNLMNIPLQMSYRAFSYHYPIVISPDMILTTIVQGFALCMNEMSVADRLDSEKIVNTDRHTVVLPERFMIDQIVPTITNSILESDLFQSEDVKTLLAHRFTTTTDIDLMVRCMSVLMAFKKLASVYLQTACGMTQITLEGTIDDWKKLKLIAWGLIEGCGQGALSKWWEVLSEFLDRLIQTRAGKDTSEFWHNYINESSGSGVHTFNGAIGCLFPILNESKAREDGKYAWNPNIFSKDGASRYMRYFGANRADALVDIDFGRVPSSFVRMHFALDGVPKAYTVSAGYFHTEIDPVTMAVSTRSAFVVRDNQN
jgi:Domain of unknown function (DUF4419)